MTQVSSAQNATAPIKASSKRPNFGEPSSFFVSLLMRPTVRLIEERQYRRFNRNNQLAKHAPRRHTGHFDTDDI